MAGAGADNDVLQEALSTHRLEALGLAVAAGLQTAGALDIVAPAAELCGSDVGPPHVFFEKLLTVSNEELTASFRYNITGTQDGYNHNYCTFQRVGLANKCVQDFQLWCIEVLMKSAGPFILEAVGAWNRDAGVHMEMDLLDEHDLVQSIIRVDSQSVRLEAIDLQGKGRNPLYNPAEEPMPAYTRVPFAVLLAVFEGAQAAYQGGVRAARDEVYAAGCIAANCEVFKLGYPPLNKDFFLEVCQKIVENVIPSAVVEVVSSHLRQKMVCPQYLRFYGSTREPDTVVELFEGLRGFLNLWCSKYGIDDMERDRFIGKLGIEVQQGNRPPDLDECRYAAVRMWTSATKLHGPQPHNAKELCSILAQVDREDSLDLLNAGAFVLQRSINSLLVTRRAGVVDWVPQTYRGSGIPRKELVFFTELKGQKYRAPMPLASSKLKGVAVRFLANVPPGGEKECVLFVFCFRSHPPPQEVPPCIHVNYLESITGVKGEEEFLFVAYSAFKVSSVKISKAPSWDYPHEVYLEVLPDNRNEPEDLPLSAWH